MNIKSKPLCFAVVFVMFAVLAGRVMAATSTPAFVQGNTAGSYSVKSLSVAFSKNVTAGDVIAFGADWGSSTATLTSVSSTCSNVFTLLNNPTSYGTLARFAQGYAVASNSGSCTVTAHFSASVSSAFMLIQEVSGVNTSTPLDGSAMQNLNGPGTGANAATSGKITTKQNGDYLFGLGIDASANGIVWTSGTGYAIRIPVANLMTSEDSIQTAAGSVAATFTITPAYAHPTVGLMAFEAANVVNATGSAPSIASFAASPTSTTLGSSSTLSWKTTNASSVTLTGNNLSLSTSTASGSITVTPNATGTLVYTLSAANANGTTTATTSVAVSQKIVPGVTSFSASPAIIAVAGTSTLSWNATNASSVAITPGNFSTSTLVGSITVNPTSTTTYTLTATSGNGTSTAVVTVVVDPQAPTMPTNLSVATTTISTVSLLWSSSTDSGVSGLLGYNIYRCSGFCVPTSIIGSTSSSTTSFIDMGLASSTTYTYAVAGYSGVGNLSGQSSYVSATTKGIVIVFPSISSFAASPTSITLGSSTVLSWNTTNASSVTITGNNLSFSTSTPSGTVSVTPNATGTLVYTLSAANANGTTTATTSVAVSNPDTQPPSVPTGLTAGTITNSSISFSWTASTDNVGVAGYNVYRRGVLIATTTVTSFTDTGLAASTTYAYAVSAFDAAGNVSAQSQALNVTTAATSSSGFTTLAESFGNGSLLCWSGGPSSCNQTWAVGGGSGNSVAALPGTPPQGTPVNSLKMTTANGTNTYLYTAGAFPAIRSGTSFDVYFPIYVTANTMGSYDMTSLFSVSGGLGGDNPAATVYFKTVSGQLQLLAGGSNFSGTTNLSLNTWYEVQLHVASGTNNSYLEVGNAASQPFTANANDFVYANIGSFAGEADAMTYYLGGLSVNSSIQGGPSPLAYVNFENGTDGTAATPAILAGGTACGNGTWSLTSGTSTGLTISTAGEKPMLTSKTVCGVPYNDVGGTRGIYYNLLNNPGSNYAGYEWANLGQPVASVGFWFKSNNVGGPDDTNSYSIFDINSTDGTDYSTFLVRQGYAYLESATEISGETPIPISPNTWYWVTLQYVQGGNQSLSIYDANGNQVGSTITRAAVAGAGAPGSISFGRTGAESGNPNGGWWFDNIVVDYLNGSFPLLP